MKANMLMYEKFFFHIFTTRVIKMDGLFEFLGLQDTLRQNESQHSISDLANDLIMNGNYTNTVDLVSDILDFQPNKN